MKLKTCFVAVLLFIIICICLLKSISKNSIENFESTLTIKNADDRILKILKKLFKLLTMILVDKKE